MYYFNPINTFVVSRHKNMIRQTRFEYTNFHAAQFIVSRTHKWKKKIQIFKIVIGETFYSYTDLLQSYLSEFTQKLGAKPLASKKSE